MRRGAIRCLVPLRTVAGLLTACIALGALRLVRAKQDRHARQHMPRKARRRRLLHHGLVSRQLQRRRRVADAGPTGRGVQPLAACRPRPADHAAGGGLQPGGCHRGGKREPAGCSRLRRTESLQLRLGRNLKPIDSCLSQRQRADLLPSIRQQGTYAGRTWGVGTFDSGLGLYVRRSILRRAGISIPTDASQAWTVAQFTRDPGASTSDRLSAAAGSSDQLRHQGAGVEHVRFCARRLVSGGRPDRPQRLPPGDGFLNGAPATRALTVIQGWAKAGYVNPNRNGMAFEEGKTPISWVGHWLFAAYTKAFPGDVQIVPLPRFGPHDVTDMGSWQWGITANATNGDAAWRFISFLLRPGQVVQMTRANGAIPGTYSAIRLSPRFVAGGPEHLYVEQLESGVARPRPQTAAYPALTAAFANAFQAIVVGRRPVKPTLDAAARSVTADLIAHDYYANTGR